MGLFAEQAKTLALIRRKLLRQFAEEIQGGFGRDGVSAFRIARRAVRVIEIQNGSLRVTIRSAVAVGEKRVAFDFDRPAFVRLHDERNCPAARRHRGCEVLRRAVDEILRRLAEGHEFILRLAAAGACQPETRQQERGGHDLDEMPPRKGIGQFTRTSRKLALQELAELRRLGQLLQAAPI